MFSVITARYLKDVVRSSITPDEIIVIFFTNFIFYSLPSRKTCAIAFLVSAPLRYQ